MLILLCREIVSGDTLSPNSVKLRLLIRIPCSGCNLMRRISWQPPQNLGSPLKNLLHPNAPIGASINSRRATLKGKILLHLHFVGNAKFWGLASLATLFASLRPGTAKILPFFLFSCLDGVFLPHLRPFFHLMGSSLSEDALWNLNAMHLPLELQLYLHSC